MNNYWITFEDGTEACCQGNSPGDAVVIAEAFTEKKVAGEEFKYRQHENPNVKQLPYPANPMIWEFKHPVYGTTPRFCHSPKTCAGKSSCPQNRSCTE